MSNKDIKWLKWAKEIQAIAQTGLAYSKDVYDRERYESLRQISIDILAHYTSIDEQIIKITFASETGYATPKVDIRGVVFQDNKILMVREKSDGAWALPGGWADIGLSPSEVVVKEIKEESGYDVKPLRLLAVLDKKYHDHPPDPYHVYKLFIECSIIGGQGQSGVETSEIGFFTENKLPKLSEERNTEKQIKRMFDLHRDPSGSVICE